MYLTNYIKIFFAILVTFFGIEGSAAHPHFCADCDWLKLLKDNEAFIHNPEYARERAPLVDGQNPSYVILSCSDSRVPPELVFQQGLGDLFVARIAGNVVDTIVVDSIEFAVGTWDVTTVVVMGHTSCGAIEGALARLREHHGKIDEPRGDHLNAVLIPIEKAIVKAGINIYGPNALEQATKANVAYSVKQLLKRSPAITKAVKDRQIIIVGSEYSLKSGRVRELFVVDHRGYTYDPCWDLHRE
jgi:carbonic anhydrase